MAALIGLPDAKLGERPVVYLVMRDGATASDSALVAFAAARAKRTLDALTIAPFPRSP
jgi:acyl-coenzyme A synthetase/AMP-(fatty) acid ligase